MMRSLPLPGRPAPSSGRPEPNWPWRATRSYCAGRSRWLRVRKCGCTGASTSATTAWSSRLRRARRRGRATVGWLPSSPTPARPTPAVAAGCARLWAISTPSGCACPSTPTTSSTQPARRGSSPCSAGTRCGPPVCCSPADLSIAASTLRVLARLQGRLDDPATAQQPGKILHELRSAALTLPGEGVELPPLYYGTVDATPLWVCLLVDAWRAGLDEDQVRALLPSLDAGAALDHRVRGRRWRRLSRLPGPDRPWPGQPGLEGLRRLDPVARRTDRRGPDRAVRGAGLRLRGCDRGC